MPASGVAVAVEVEAVARDQRGDLAAARQHVEEAGVDGRGAAGRVALAGRAAAAAVAAAAGAAAAVPPPGAGRLDQPHVKRAELREALEGLLLQRAVDVVRARLRQLELVARDLLDVAGLGRLGAPTPLTVKNLIRSLEISIET